MPAAAGDARAVEDQLRALAPRVLGVLVRRYGQFTACEDATQEALIAAAGQWPVDGLPESPQAWLVTVAQRRLIDQFRAESARREREELVALEGETDPVAAADAGTSGEEEDDTLTLLFLCCHPALSAGSQLALTLRAVGGLSTAQIAAAFLVPEATMAQRISRAKASIKSGGAAFVLPDGPERTERLRVVLHVLYLMFTEGHVATSGADLQRAELTAEAIRLARAVHALLPGDGEVSGLLALLLLTDARRAARASVDGALVPLAEQDRTRWDGARIAEGVALIEAALQGPGLGPYQLQAAIAAVHAEARTADETDWPQILALYELLERVAPNPMFTLNRAVAVAMVNGAAAGLALVATLDADARVAGHHRVASVRAHLLELAGDGTRARAAYLAAARGTTSLPEQRYLQARAARLA